MVTAMLSLAWATIRARKAAFVASFLALFGGAVLFTACGVLLESGLFGGVPAQRYAAAPVVVGGNQSVTAKTNTKEAESRTEQLAEKVPVDANLLGTVAGIPGVTKVVGEVSFPATVVAPDGRVLSGADGGHSLGHGWGSAELTPFTVRAGSAPAGPRDVVLDAELARRAGVSVGGTVRISVHAQPVAYHVSGVAAPSGKDGLDRQSAVFFTDDVARSLSADPGKLAAIGVFGDSSELADRVEKALRDNGNVAVHSGSERGEAESPDGAQSRQILMLVSSSFSGFVLMIVIFVTASTLALVLNQRRREIALLRAIAATPGQVRRLIGIETTLVSGLGALLGIWPGIYAAYGIRDVFVKIGVIPEGFELSISPVPMAASVVLCVGAAWLAAWTSARRMLKVKPIEALGEAAVEKAKLGRGRMITGQVMLLLAGTGVTATLVLSGQLAVVPAVTSSLFAVIGVGLLGPALMSRATRVIGRLLLGSGGTAPYLAARNSMANSRRLAAAVTPLVLTLGFSVTMFYSQTTLADAVQQQARAATTADFVLTAPAGVPVDVAAAARSVPGVRAATPLIGSEALVLDHDASSEPITRVKANGVDAGQLAGTLSLAVKQGRFDDLRGDTVALSEFQASWQGKHIGDKVDMYLGDRTRVSPRLVAVFENNLGYGDMLLPQDTLLPHTTTRTAGSVLVSTEGTADRAAVEQGLRALGGTFPGLAVADRHSLTVATDGQQQANDWLNRILLGVILLYVALSVVNTLVTATLDRSRELTLLRLVGGTRRQVLRMIRVESWIVVAIAAVLGSALPVLPLAFLSFNFTGSPLPAGPPLVYLGILAVTVLIGLLSIRLPARKVARTSLADNILTRE
ncbi:FtsX-like permease family protein [Amycolatopsis sp. NPDC059021]|uniref:FtsX-like permease family protein n=1 Tax=Amycolatopsis sp. NPDC059021 TaxID=3346704 RepID=UPI00366E1790